MAGFMSGFGQAFSQSFAQERQASINQKQDKFRMDYANALTRRDKELEQDKANKKNIALAKSIAQATGQPTGSWTTFYDMLSGDMKPDDVMKFATENQAQIASGQVETNTPGAMDSAGGDLTQAAQSSVDAQMSESGMKPPQNGGIFGNLGQPNNAPASMQAQTGMPQTPEQVPAQNTPSPLTTQSANGGIAGQTAGATAGQTAGNVQPQPPAPKPDNVVEEQNLPGADGNKITWTKKAPTFKAPNPWEVTSSNDALGYKNWAYEFGGPKDRARADKMVNSFTALDQWKARQSGIANGTYSEPNGATLIKPNGEEVLLTKAQDGNGGQYWANPDGTPAQEQGRLVEHSPAMEKDIDDMADKMVKPVEDYTKTVSDFKQTNKTGAELIKLVEQHPEAAGLSGDALQWFDKWKRGIQGVLFVSGVNGEEIMSPKTLQVAQEAEANLQKELADPMNKANQGAIAAALIDIKSTKLAYMAAAAEGQTGKGVSQQEFNAFKNNILAGGNPEAMKLGIASTVKDQYDNLKLQSANINVNSALMRRFKSKYGINAPFQPVDDPDQILKSDDEIRQNYEYLDHASKDNTLTQSKQPQTLQGSKDYTPIGKTPDGKTVYQGPDGKRYVE